MEHIRSHYKEVSKYFDSEKLIDLADNSGNYNGLENLEILEIESVNSKFKKFNKHKNREDIIHCNSDLKYLTANLYLYRPFINNPLNEYHIHKGIKHSTYLQTTEDWIYSLYVSCCYEKLYNFWDRIGDTLAYYLELKIPEEQVSFPKVMESLIKERDFSCNENFRFLKDFYENEFKEFNKHRKEVVHYYQFETTYSWEVINGNDQRSEIERLWKWKESMPEYFKNHLRLSCEGFFNTYYLINNLP